MGQVTGAPVTRFIAGPGTGKTHTLLELVRREAEEHGTRIGDITFSTFARSQKAEVQARIGTVYPKAKRGEIGGAVVTLHAAALRACKAAGLFDTAAGDRIIQEGIKKAGAEFFEDFARLHHLPYDPALARFRADEDRKSGQAEPPGNALFKIARYIRGQYTWNWSHAPHAMTATGTHIPSSCGDAAELLQAWSDYKAEHQLYEHDDYIFAAIEAEAGPLAPILIVDEFQDLSPLQFVLFTQWRQSGEVVRIYVAGDPNQAIYAFRGADPIFLEKIPGPVKDIGAAGDQAPESRRCPPEIVRTADRVLGGRSFMAPRAGAGRVWVEHPYDDAGFPPVVEALYREYGEVLILARYRRYVRKLSKVLTAAGIPHTSLLSDWSPHWETARTTAGEPVDMRQLLGALDALTAYDRNGGAGILTPDQARTLITAAPRMCTPPENMRGAFSRPEAVLIPEVIGWFSDTPPAPGFSRRIAAGLELSEDLTAGIPAALARGPSRPAPSAIVLSTIHAAKGGQARAVVLHTGYNRGRYREYWQNPTAAAEEHRVYYVACTRASDALVILDGLRPGPSAPPLQGIAGVRS